MIPSSLGRFFTLFGVVRVVVGLFLLRGPGWCPPGKLPDDFVIRRGHTNIYLPLTTSLVVSVVVSLWLRWLR